MKRVFSVVFSLTVLSALPSRGAKVMASSEIADVGPGETLDQADLRASLKAIEDETRQNLDYRQTKVDQLTPLEAKMTAAQLKLRELQNYESFLKGAQLGSLSPSDGLKVRDDIMKVEAEIYELKVPIDKLKDVIEIIDEMLKGKEQRKEQILKSLESAG